MKTYPFCNQFDLLTESCHKARQLWYLCCLIMCLPCISCEQKDNSSGKVLVDTYFEAAFANDYDALNKLLHDDFIFLGPKLSDTLDKQGLIKSWQSTHFRNDTLLMRNPKTYDVSEQENLANNEYLILHYYDARFHNSDLDLWVEFPVHVKFSIFKDRIQQAQIIMNQSDVQKQLGYKIILPVIQ